MLHFFNDLFDSFNGKNGQGLSSIITENSGHIHFWQEASNRLINMGFVDKLTRKVPRKNAPRCLKNWIWTIKGAKIIWDIVHRNNFESLNLKFLNQDVLENFFSQIRSNSANRNPNPYQFEGAFKSLLVSNYTSKHSIGANCQENNEGNSFALSHLINVSEELINSNENNETDSAEAAIPSVTTSVLVLDENKIMHYIRNNKIIAQCKECEKSILENPLTLKFLQDASVFLEKVFVNICHETKLAQKLTCTLEEKCPSVLLQCSHMKEIILRIISEEFIKSSCTLINKILCRKIDIPCDNHIYNEAKRLSQKYCFKESERKTAK